jgi:NAD(P)-dependent dehydrogenase (short-subunit alcohol dehydrogenase family)
LVRRVVELFGRLDLLVVNHAAMMMAPVEGCSTDDWWHIVDVNLSGSFYLAQSAAVHLRRTRGAMIFISSEWGVTGWPGATAYAASKAGLIGLMKSLALAYAPGIRVNAVAPGVIDTAQLEVDAAAAGVSIEEMKARYAADAPIGRVADPAEIAATVVFLATPDASFYIGQVLRPNGGSSTAS